MRNRNRSATPPEDKPHAPMPLTSRERKMLAVLKRCHPVMMDYAAREGGDIREAFQTLDACIAEIERD